MSRWRAAEGPASPARQKAGQPASADPSIRQAGRGRRSVKGRPARERRAAPASAELCPRAVSPARRWTSCATTHRERPKARAPIAWHLGTFAAICHRPVINNLGDAIMNHECCAYTQRTYPNGHALGDRVPTASTGPSRPLLHMRLKAFAGPFGVCYQVVTRTTWQLVALSGLHLNSISLHKAAAVAPSRATTRCPASLLASRRTYTALYRIYPHQRVSRYKRSWCHPRPPRRLPPPRPRLRRCLLHLLPSRLQFRAKD